MKTPKAARIHAESLLHVPLVRQMMDDPQVELAPRGVDASWFYEKVVPVKLGGFNATRGAVFYPAKSFLARWLRAPSGSARRLNENDFLTSELFFAVHDYLHVWAYLAIGELEPHVGFGVRAITRDNLDDFVFCHIVSEAVATVGLDYWYLCTLSLNDVCDIGTRMERGLTVDYHERFAREYRRYGPDFRVQHEGFFRAATEFYCSGVFDGFDLAALRESPIILRWLEHELLYGRLQRRYAREWLAYLSHEDITLGARALDAPLSLDRAWKRRLVDRIGAMLWEKVKHGKMHAFDFRFGDAFWKSSPKKPADFRFVNIHSFPSISAALRAPASRDPESRAYRVHQLTSLFDYERCDPALRRAVALLPAKSGADRLAKLLHAQPRLRASAGEPRDLFLLG